jgi:hypothetical protein
VSLKVEQAGIMAVMSGNQVFVKFESNGFVCFP